MNSQDSHIAILYFSRTAKAESRAKRWLNDSREKNLNLSTSLTRSANAILSKTSLPVYHYHEGLQKGKTFGERLSNAFQEVFRYGYEGVIAVGNDSPEIGTTDFNKVANLLIAGDCVLGPSLRGGTYLIGLTKNAFNKDRFQNLPWQRQNLFNALEDELIKTQTVIRLKRLRDVNTLHDFLALAKSSSLSVAFQKWVRHFLKEPNSSVIIPERIVREYSHSAHSLRGPPCLI